MIRQPDGSPSELLHLLANGFVTLHALDFCKTRRDSPRRNALSCGKITTYQCYPTAKFDDICNFETRVDESSMLRSWLTLVFVRFDGSTISILQHRCLQNSGRVVGRVGEVQTWLFGL